MAFSLASSDSRWRAMRSAMAFITASSSFLSASLPGSSSRPSLSTTCVRVGAGVDVGVRGEG